jgi:hypothetical protein
MIKLYAVRVNSRGSVPARRVAPRGRKPFKARPFRCEMHAKLQLENSSVPRTTVFT